MEDDQQELRFVCKLCNKKYPCGKSLGGHMRSHVIANSAESAEKIDSHMKKISAFSKTAADFGNNNGQTSYGLRENPRKTWRAVDSTSSPLPQESRICKQCGKGFQSLKALCGHMACHSDRDKGLKDDQSWSTSENQKLVMESHSDSEAEERILRSSKSRRYKKIVFKSHFSLANNNNNGSSSVSEIDGEEQEEVAMCLMLLSRDKGGGVNSVVESSDNNSVILETKSSSIDMRTGKREGFKEVHNQDEMIKKIGDLKSKEEIAEIENSDSGYFLDECAKYESDVSVDGSRRNAAFIEYDKPLYGAEFRQSLNRSKRDNEYDNGGMASNFGRIESRKRRYTSESPDLCDEYDRNIKAPNEEVCNISHQKRSKYECFNCKKTFKSYQALGGHRPCHKRSNTFYESRYDSGENSLDDSMEFVIRDNKHVESSSKRKSSANKKLSHEKKSKAKKNKGHVCPFCDRVFKNGQALGGHKRSHFIGGHIVENNNQSAVKKADLLDLNLPPAPEEEQYDGNDQFSSWMK